MTKTKNNNKPLISFCITTYKRPKLLKKTLQSILSQTYENWEIVVCDNDSKASSKPAVDSLKSKKIKYIANKKNLGMVPSFNKAFKNSTGDFIVFMADDDPVYPDMLETLINLEKEYPNCMSYFGAFDSYVSSDKQLARKIMMKVGKTSGRNFDWEFGSKRVFSSKEFLELALKGDIFYYLMWSTGIVRRSVVEKFGKDPVREYGSALMTDRCYCLEVAAAGDTAIINKELGCQTVHKQSFSLNESNDDMIINGFVGYYNTLKPIIKKYNLQKLQEEFLFRHVFNLFIIIRISGELIDKDVDIINLMKVYDKLSTRIPVLTKRRFELYLILHRRFPFEIIFKAIHTNPVKLVKKTIRFILQRILPVSALEN